MRGRGEVPALSVICFTSIPRILTHENNRIWIMIRVVIYISDYVTIYNLIPGNKTILNYDPKSQPHACCMPADAAISWQNSEIIAVTNAAITWQKLETLLPVL